MKKNICLYILGLFLAACSSFQAVDHKELQDSQLVGRWETTFYAMDGNHEGFFEIFCSGAFQYRRPNALNWGGSTATGNVINKVNQYSFDGGPFWKTRYKVQEWPHTKNGKTYVTIDGTTYVKTQAYMCDKDRTVSRRELLND